MSHQIVELPLKSHLVEYLSKAWRIDTSTPIQITSQSPFGHYIYQCIKTNNGLYKSKLNYNTVISLKVYEYDREGKSFDGRCSALYIHDVDAKRFNDALEMMMERELFNVLDGILERNPKTQIKKEINAFMQKYNLVEHNLTYERFKKAYYRDRKARESA